MRNLSEDGEALYLVERNLEGWFPCFYVQMYPAALRKFLSFLVDPKHWRPEWVCGNFRVKRVRYRKGKAKFLFYSSGLLVKLDKNK